MSGMWSGSDVGRVPSIHASTQQGIEGLGAGLEAKERRVDPEVGDSLRRS
jgi:hypothetical protein